MLGLAGVSSYGVSGYDYEKRSIHGIQKHRKWARNQRSFIATQTTWKTLSPFPLLYFNIEFLHLCVILVVSFLSKISPPPPPFFPD